MIKTITIVFLFFLIFSSCKKISHDTQVYNVNFDPNGGSHIASQSIISEMKLKKPEAPSKEGNFFGGWYKDDAFTERFDFSKDIVEENTNLYAYWFDRRPSTREDLEQLLFTGDVDPNTIDVSLITDMSDLFKGKSSFNKPLDKWDVSNVTNMKGMFHGASSFNQPIDGWNTSNVISMNAMFSGASSFNQPIDGWNTSNVIYMNSMFANTSSFDQSIKNWDMSKVRYMIGMFYNTEAFNQDLENWNTSSVVDMRHIFEKAKAFNSPIGKWDISNVTDMSYMFSEAKSFNQNIDTWDVSNVTSMNSLFQGAEVFNKPLNNWDVSRVKDMKYMFHESSEFDQPLTNWNVNIVWNASKSGAGMTLMFNEAKAFTNSVSKEGGFGKMLGWRVLKDMSNGGLGTIPTTTKTAVIGIPYLPILMIENRD